jgi:TetR/AcrR family transcriptional regulator
MASSSRVLRRASPRCAAPESSARDRLLCAAVELFERKGYAATSVREIVQKAGVAKPALYYYFRSKEGLLIAALELAAGALDRLLAEAAASRGTARARLSSLADRVLAASRSHASLVRVAHAVAFSPREAVPLFDFSVFARSIHGALGRIVSEGVAAGEIRRACAPDAVRAFQSLLILSIGHHAGDRAGTLAPAEMHRLINLVFDGAGAAPRLGKGASS